MSWPWIAESNFELGDNSEWVAETDTGTKLDFPHYSQLASQHTFSAAVPYQGAYCMRVQQDGTTTNAHVRRTEPIAATTTTWFRFQLCVGDGWTAGPTTNTFTVFRVMGSATTTVIGSVGFRVGRVNATSIEPAVGVSVPTVFAASDTITLNTWHTMEVQVVTSDATSANGSITIYLDGSQAATVANASQSVVPAEMRLGIFSAAAPNIGVMLFDKYIMDDTRLGPALGRQSETRHLTKSGHVFVGSGRVDNLTLIAQAVTTSVVELYDTDQGGIMSQDKMKARMAATTSLDTQDLANVPIYFERGCYASITPTAVASQPRVIVVFQAHAELEEGAKRLHGQRVKNRAFEAL